MKVSRKKCAENHDEIISAAARLFCEKGFDGIAVADIMKAAGLPHGGFYGHFDSKDELAAEATKAALARLEVQWKRVIERAPDRPLRLLLEDHLSERHRDDPGKCFVFAALVSDVARRGGAVRSVFTDGLKAFSDLLARVVPRTSQAMRRHKALSSMSEMVGAVILARAVDDRALSDEILAACSRSLANESRA